MSCPPIATQAEAEAGTANDRMMTPLRTKEAINVLGVSPTVLASPAGAEMVGFEQSGADAVIRSVQNELRETIKLTQFGGANDSAQLIAALSAHAGRCIHIPYRATPYQITQKIVVPANTTIVFERGATCSLDYNGDAFELGHGAFISHLNLHGNGATWPVGRGVVIAGTNGRNGLIEPKIADTALACIAFTTTGSGSGFFMLNADLARHSGGGQDSTSVVIDMADGSLAAEATPRTFVGTQTNGYATANLGGCNDVFFAGGSFHGPFYFSEYSRGVKITGIRWALQTVAHIKGCNISIVGCGVAPKLVIDAASINPAVLASGQSVTITGNDMNNPRVVDNSGWWSTNTIQHNRVPETSALRGDGTILTVAGGNNRNGVYRNGQEYCLDIDLEGSWVGGTALPNGLGASSSLTFDVPCDYMPTFEQFVGPINMTYNGGQKQVFGRLFGTTTLAGNYLSLGYFDGSGNFVNYTAAALSSGAGVTRLRGTFRWTR
jgi:hypothetical protein